MGAVELRSKLFRGLSNNFRSTMCTMQFYKFCAFGDYAATDKWEIQVIDGVCNEKIIEVPNFGVSLTLNVFQWKIGLSAQIC